MTSHPTNTNSATESVPTKNEHPATSGLESKTNRWFSFMGPECNPLSIAIKSVPIIFRGLHCNQ